MPTQKSIAKQSAVSAAVVKITPQTQKSFSSAVPAGPGAALLARSRWRTALFCTCWLISRSCNIRRESGGGRRTAHPQQGGDCKKSLRERTFPCDPPACRRSGRVSTRAGGEEASPGLPQERD